MISLKAPKPPQPKFAAGRRSSDDKVAMMPHSVPSHDEISERAYQLYESRGREPGQHEQDWLRAEQQISKAAK